MTNHPGVIGFPAALLGAFLIGACCNAGDEPAAPYANPDDTIRSSGDNGYATVTYIYYCHNQLFVSATYVRQDKCSDYKKNAEFTSDGMCEPAEPLRAALSGLSPAEQVRVLRAAGRTVNVIYERDDARGLLQPH